MLIRKRRLVEDSLYKHSANEMANMGTTRGGITIKVYSGEGPIPHLHFIIDENHQGCLQLEQAEYFNHGQHTATLNTQQLKDVIIFLSSSADEHGFNPGWSKYVDCCSEWNKNNPQYAMSRQEMPDYSTINDNLFEYVHKFPDGSSLKKMLFGFKSLENYEKFSQKIKDNTDTFADYEGYEDFRAKANAKIVALRESHDRKRFFEKNRFDLHDVLETAEAFLVNLVSLHDDYHYNEFPEETFEQASYVLEVMKKLGTPSEYEESKSLYDYWISNVKVLKPIISNDLFFFRSTTLRTPWEFARAMIRYNIENYEGWYWAEVSGKVEYLMKKYNGYPIPNIYAEEILNKHGQLELDEDGVHYFRQVGLEDTTKHRKVIYGFKHQELFDRVKNSVLDILGVSMSYADFQNYANDLPDEIDLNSPSQKSVTKVLTRVLEQATDSSVDIVKNAKNYIESIGNAFYEDDINEFPNDVIKCLDLCLKLLRQFGDKYINAITQGEELREMITPLEMHTF